MADGVLKRQSPILTTKWYSATVTVEDGFGAETVDCGLDGYSILGVMDIRSTSVYYFVDAYTTGTSLKFRASHRVSTGSGTPLVYAKVLYIKND